MLTYAQHIVGLGFDVICGVAINRRPKKWLGGNSMCRKSALVWLHLVAVRLKETTTRGQIHSTTYMSKFVTYYQEWGSLSRTELLQKKHATGKVESAPEQYRMGIRTLRSWAMVYFWCEYIQKLMHIILPQTLHQKHQHMLFLTYLWVRTYDGRLFSLRPAEQGKQNMKHTYKHTANRTYIQQKLSRLHCWRRASLHHKNVKQGVVAGVLDESNLSSYVHNKGLSQYFMWPTLHHLTVKLVPATYIWFNLILSSKIKCQVVKRTRDPLLEGFELLSRPSDIRELQPVHYP